MRVSRETGICKCILLQSDLLLYIHNTYHALHVHAGPARLCTSMANTAMATPSVYPIKGSSNG